MGGKKFGGIPDRWLNYTKIGNQIEGTQFVAFKVPLKPELTESQAEDIRFNIAELVERLPTLGLVVDLTNTDRYYDSSEFKKHGVEYCKIATKGHEIPESQLVQKFFRVAKDFLQQMPEKLVGVHCTHGVNRTGYFICSFMILESKLQANDAIDRFDEARGHKQERGNYLTALRLLHQTTPPVVNVVRELDHHPRTMWRNERGNQERFVSRRNYWTPNHRVPESYRDYPDRRPPLNYGPSRPFPMPNEYQSPLASNYSPYEELSWQQDRFHSRRNPTRWSRQHDNQTSRPYSRYGGNSYF